MIRLIQLIAAVGVALVTTVAARPAYAVAWQEGTLADAVRRAKQSKRWVLVDVFATWCGPCHAMDDKVYPQREVTQAIERDFVALRRDGETGEGAEIAARYHVVGFPTILLIDENGVEVDRVMGFVDGRELVETLARFRAGRGTIAALERQLQATPGDEALRLEVGRRHAMRGDARAVVELGQVVVADPENRGKRASAALFTLGKYYWQRGMKDQAKALATLEELVRRFPSSPEAQDAPYPMAIALHALGRDGEARKVLDAWLEAAPRDVSRYNAYAWMSFKEGFDRARGIEVARRGLAIDEKEHGLWDTLAELLAATGKTAEARQAAERALALKPGDAYYAAQVRRFEAAEDRSETKVDRTRGSGAKPSTKEGGK
jgi:Flp pilus assembly protein TadD